MKKYIDFLNGKSQGFNLPDWFIFFMPKFKGNDTWKWLFLTFHISNSLAGDTFFMAIKR